MAHEIGKKREIIVSFEKIFGKTVAERMRIHDSRIYAIPPCKKFQLLGYASGRYAFAKRLRNI